jgi:hypothetical protein
MGPPLKGGVYQFFQWGMSLVSEGDFSTTRWGLKKSLSRATDLPSLRQFPPSSFGRVEVPVSYNEKLTTDLQS